MGFENMTEEQRAELNRKSAEARQRKIDFKQKGAGSLGAFGVEVGKLRAWVQSVPERFRNLANRHVEGSITLGQSVRLKCAECCGFEELYLRVGRCSAWRCPLWHHRPYQKGEELEQ